ncbi:MAG: phosphate acyltransferase PlsX [Bacteroidetes bacterium]|nr:phosphate acyltransferase PlsX [Bacteroidota bacterium]
MGGDFAPAYEVQGAIECLRQCENRLHIILVGDEPKIRLELQKHSAEGLNFSVVHAPDVIDMHDSPVVAIKTKPNSSLVKGITMHKEGLAEAFVSPGNTGAVTAASTLILGRIPGVSRPSVAAIFPSEKGPVLVVDAGAVSDCKPHFLFEFGVMGSLYSEYVFKKKNPRVGLLNIGEEESKGNELAKDAYKFISERKGKLNFVGNIEGRDILKGNVDVVMCDGFVGNVLLKFAESVPGYLKFQFKKFAAQGFVNKLMIGMLRGSLKEIFRDMDYTEFGGIPLLGVNGVTIIGHGSSPPKAIKNMIFRAEEVVNQKINQQIQESLKEQQ